MLKAVRGKAVEPRRGERVNIRDRGLLSLPEALLIHCGVELTGERTAPPLMMAAKVRVRRRWRVHCKVSLME